MPEASDQLPFDIATRPDAGHKGMFGRLLIVGGSSAMIGAPMLTARSAMRSGIGLAQVAMPRDVLAIALTILPEAIGLPLSKEEGRSKLKDACAQADALVVGPGMGVSRVSRERLSVVLQSDKPAVIDADALNLIAMGKRIPKCGSDKCVFTPHPGEMRRLAKLLEIGAFGDDDESRLGCALQAARRLGHVVVLKGHRTVVADAKGRTFINTTGDSTLSKAGAGDVLCGVIGTLLAQKSDAFEAACAGVYLHGLAGELAGKSWTQRSALASDIADHLPRAFQSVESAPQSRA